MPFILSQLLGELILSNSCNFLIALAALRWRRASLPFKLMRCAIRNGIVQELAFQTAVDYIASVSLNPHLRKIVIAGHQLVKAD